MNEFAMQICNESQESSYVWNIWKFSYRFSSDNSLFLMIENQISNEFSFKCENSICLNEQCICYLVYLIFIRGFHSWQNHVFCN